MLQERLKEAVRQHAPAPVLKAATAVYKKRIAMNAHKHDKKVFDAARFHAVEGSTLTQLEGKLTFHAHSLEKGLSHDQIRYQFGKTPLQELSFTMLEYDKRGFPKDRSPYRNALSTLKAYWDCHLEAGEDTSEFETILGPTLFAEISETTSTLGGVFSLAVESKMENQTKNFEQLFVERSSVREFDDRAVDPSRIFPAIQIAIKSPSVCNRQSSRVKIVTNEKLIGDLLKLQGGMSGYKLPPALLVVTADLAPFLEPTERNQPFVDGGLFAMGLLLALEYEGLAACPLNAMMTAEKENSVLSLLNLSKNERVIVLIAVGEFPEKTKVPKSFRLPKEEILTIYS